MSKDPRNGFSLESVIRKWNGLITMETLTLKISSLWIPNSQYCVNPPQIEFPTKILAASIMTIDALIERYSQYLVKKDFNFPSSQYKEKGRNYVIFLMSIWLWLKCFIIFNWFIWKEFIPIALTDFHLCREENCSPIPTAAWNSIIDAMSSFSSFWYR